MAKIRIPQNYRIDLSMHPSTLLHFTQIFVTSKLPYEMMAFGCRIRAHSPLVVQRDTPAGRIQVDQISLPPHYGTQLPSFLMPLKTRLEGKTKFHDLVMLLTTSLETLSRKFTIFSKIFTERVACLNMIKV